MYKSNYSLFILLIGISILRQSYCGEFEFEDSRRNSDQDPSNQTTNPPPLSKTLSVFRHFSNLLSKNAQKFHSGLQNASEQIRNARSSNFQAPPPPLPSDQHDSPSEIIDFESENPPITDKTSIFDEDEDPEHLDLEPDDDELEGLPINQIGDESESIQNDLKARNLYKMVILTQMTDKIGKSGPKSDSSPQKSSRIEVKLNPFTLSSHSQNGNQVIREMNDLFSESDINPFLNDEINPSSSSRKTLERSKIKEIDKTPPQINHFAPRTRSRMTLSTPEDPEESSRTPGNKTKLILLLLPNESYEKPFKTDDNTQFNLKASPIRGKNKESSKNFVSLPSGSSVRYAKGPKFVYKPSGEVRGSSGKRSTSPKLIIMDPSGSSSTFNSSIVSVTNGNDTDRSKYNGLKAVEAVEDVEEAEERGNWTHSTIKKIPQSPIEPKVHIGVGFKERGRKKKVEADYYDKYEVPEVYLDPRDDLPNFDYEMDEIYFDNMKVDGEKEDGITPDPDLLRLESREKDREKDYYDYGGGGGETPEDLEEKKSDYVGYGEDGGGGPRTPEDSPRGRLAEASASSNNFDYFDDNGDFDYFGY